MIGQKIPQARKLVGIQVGSRRMALMQVMLGLALWALISSLAPSAAAFFGNDSLSQQGQPQQPPAQRSYASRADGVWFSDDAGISWTQAGALPSRALALAVAEQTSSPQTLSVVFVGTESVGLLRSDDGGASWQPIDSAVLTQGNAAPLAVTALAIDPQDAQIVYAATAIWLGTNTAHLSPLGVAVSVDGGRQWLQLSSALLSDTPIQRLEPVAGRPLAVVAVNSTGSQTVSLALSPGLLGLLQDSDPAIRASAARAIGLIRDPAALPGLMHALADPDALAGQRSAEAIGRIGDLSVSPVLLNMLNSASAAERTRAALALGLLKSAEAVPGLAALLSAGDPEAQRVAAGALAAIGTRAAMAALMAPLADLQVTSARHAAMGGLETAGYAAVSPLAVALGSGNAVVRANAAEMLGWLKSADAVAALAPLLSDPNPTVQAQAAWALGEINTGPARLALIPASMPAPNSAPILAPAARPVAPAPLAALPAVIAEVPADYWSLAVLAALLMLALLAVVLTWKGPRPASHLGPV